MKSKRLSFFSIFISFITFFNISIIFSFSTLTILSWDRKAYALSKTDISKVAEEITIQIDGSVQGSGVLIKKVNDLYTVLTAWHVIKENSFNEEVIIKTNDGKTHNWQGDSLTQIGSIDLATFTFKSQENYKVAKIVHNKYLLEDNKYLLEDNKVFIAVYPSSKALNLKRD